MGRLVPFILVVVILASLSPLVGAGTGTSTMDYTVVPGARGFTAYLTLDGRSLGDVRLSLMELGGRVYDLSISYVLNTDTLRDAAGLGFRLTVVIDYTAIQENGGVLEGRIVLKESSGSVRLASRLGIGDLEAVRVSELAFLVSAYGPGGSVFGVVDLANVSRGLGLKLYLVKNLDKYFFTVRSETVDPGWVNFKVSTRSGLAAILRVTAAPWFNYTRALRIYYDVIRRDFASMARVDVSLEVLVDGVVVRYDAELRGGKDLVVPGDVPGLESGSEIVVTGLSINVSIPSYSVAINVINATGPVRIVPPPKVSPLPLEARLLGVRALGNGWVEVLLGANQTLSYRDIYLDYLAEPGTPEPLVVRGVVVYGAQGFETLVKVLLAFPAGGEAKGTLRVAYGSRLAKLGLYNISVDLEGGAEAWGESLVPEYSVEEVNFTWILEIDRIERLLRLGMVPEGERYAYEAKLAELRALLDRYGELGREYVVTLSIGRTLGLADFADLLLNLSIVPDNPGEKVVILVEPEVKPSPFEEPHEYYYLLNTSNWGYLDRLLGREGGNLSLRLRLGLLAEGCGVEGGEAAGKNRLLQVRVRIVNAAEVKVRGVSGRLLHLSEPGGDAGVCGFFVEEAPSVSLLDQVREASFMVVPLALLLLGLALLLLFAARYVYEAWRV